MLLDLSALRASVVREKPFRWAAIPKLLPRDSAAELRASFPSENFWLNEGRDGEKTYRFRMRPLVTADAERRSALPPVPSVWAQFIEDLRAPEFRAAMGEVLSVDATRCTLEADWFRFGPEDWMGPHRDLPAKLASLILYLNDEGWETAHGGCLRILRSRAEADVVAEVLPESGSGALIVRSRRSWHSVTPLRPGVPSDRISVQIILWRPEHSSSNWTVDPQTGEVSAGRRVYNGSLPRRVIARSLDSMRQARS